jgi:hypothetical protein
MFSHRTKSLTGVFFVKVRLWRQGFANAIGRLRTLGFIGYPDRGSVAAKPVLFLE